MKKSRGEGKERTRACRDCRQTFEAANPLSYLVIFDPGGGGVHLGILGGVVQPGSPNPDPISDQKMPFSTPVVFRPRPLKSLTVFRPGVKAEVISSFLRLERKQKISPKALRIRIFDNYVHTFPYFAPKPYPIPDQNGQSVYPFSIPFGAAHIYMAYIR